MKSDNILINRKGLMAMVKDKDFRPVLLMSFVFFIMVTVPNFFGWYGYFCDEFYYIACAKHLAFGYIDHPFLAPLILRFVGELTGYSIIAIRILPALAGSVTIIITALITKELGGNRFACNLSALAMAISPVLILFSTFFSMNPFDVLLWSLLFLVAIRMLKYEELRLWLIIGLIAGIGFENKHTMVLPFFFMATCLLLFNPLKHLKSKFFWTGIGIILLLILPNIIWQLQNNFYSLEFYKQASLNKNVPTSPLQALLGQILFMQPLTFPIWITGLISIFILKKFRYLLPVGFAIFLLLLMFLFSNSSRPDRIAGIYTVLFAFGAVVIENIIQNNPVKFLKGSIISILIISWSLFLPYINPILPPDLLEKYILFVGWSPQIEKNKKEIIPQWIGDRLGWEEAVQSIAEAYYKLPEEEKKEVVILSSNYAFAGAVDLFGSKYGLPQAICTHNNYWLWRYGNWKGNILLAVSFPTKDLKNAFKDVEEIGKISCEECPSYMENQPIYKAKILKAPIEELWKTSYIFR